MIAGECFQKEWITRQAKELGCADPNMLEKAIMALQLLGHLAETGLPFQFKGGTSLLLLLKPIRRLSIDIDIVTQASKEGLDEVLKLIATKSPFKGIVHALDRDKVLPPKRHFRARYPSLFEPKEQHILLDVLFEPAVKGNQTIIRTPFITVEREVSVTVPSINGMLGDKLTAFAPTTIGILHHPERRTDIVKQMFDVAALFDAATDLHEAATMYDDVHKKQCEYRALNLTKDQTLDDSIAAAASLSMFELKGAPEDENAAFLRKGVGNLANHLINMKFGMDEARIAAGKAAYVATWLKRRPGEIKIEAMRYNKARIEELKEQTINKWPSLTNLKKTIPEAFHYWYQADKLSRGLPMPENNRKQSFGPIEEAAADARDDDAE